MLADINLPQARCQPLRVARTKTRLLVLVATTVAALLQRTRPVDLTLIRSRVHLDITARLPLPHLLIHHLGLRHHLRLLVYSLW